MAAGTPQMSAAYRAALILGDSAIDWFEEQVDRTPIQPTETSRSVLNLQLRGGWKWHELPGGSLLIDRMFYHALQGRGAGATHCVLSPIGERDPSRTLAPRRAIDGQDRKGRRDRTGLVHSLAVVAQRDTPHGALSSWRVTRYLGFSIDDAHWRPRAPESVQPTVLDFRQLPQFSEARRPHLVLIDDAGNGFRHLVSSLSWKAIESATHYHPILVLKLGQPLLPSDTKTVPTLWTALTALRSRFSHRYILLAADDLRRENVDISHRLSWDRTVENVLHELSLRGSALAYLTKFATIIIRCGLDGALIVPEASEPSRRTVTLICDPSRIEGDTERQIWDSYDKSRPTFVPGTHAAFTTAFALTMFLDGAGDERIVNAVRAGLLSAVSLYAQGFVTRCNSSSKDYELDYDYVTIFQHSNLSQVLTANYDLRRDRLYRFEVGNRARGGRKPGADTSEKVDLLNTSYTDLVQLARDYVREGLSTLARAPILRIGQLITADRTEIESFRSIANLIDGHLSDTTKTRPLSIAVFGPPGAGKSFGISQIAKAIGQDRVDIIEVNVAQFTSHRDLIGAFHLARDKVIGGKVPLVFFDEFDATFEGSAFGWLKFFLSPMQDARFRDESRTHAIDRAIFVFAGGTRSSYASFANQKAKENKGSDLNLEKRPDFVSRLHGFVDVRGPNRLSVNDRGFVLRRAIILRQKLYEYGPGLFKDKRKDGHLSVAEPVLEAFLRVPKYRHGARSMEALIRMTGLTAAIDHLEQAMIPQREQLDLHVDGGAFEDLMNVK